MKSKIVIFILFLYNLTSYPMKLEESKKLKTAKEFHPIIFFNTPTSLTHQCLKKVSQTIKESIDQKDPLARKNDIKKNIIKTITDISPCLKEALWDYLQENTQPMWTSIGTFIADAVPITRAFQKNIIAWIYENASFYYNCTTYLMYLDKRNPKLITHYELPSCPFTNMNISNNEQLIAFIDRHTVYVWNLAIQELTEIPAGQAITLTTCIFSHDNNEIICGAADGTCYFITNIHESPALYPIKISESALVALQTSPDNSALFAADDQGNVSISYREDNFQVKDRLDIPDLSDFTLNHRIKNIKISPNARFIVINFDNLQESVVYNLHNGFKRKLDAEILMIDNNNCCIGRDQCNLSDKKAEKFQLEYYDYDSLDFSCQKQKEYFILPMHIFPLPKAGYPIDYQNKQYRPHPLCAIAKNIDQEVTTILVEETPTLKQLFFKIALTKADKGELEALLRHKQLKNFKRKFCGNMIKKYILHRLKSCRSTTNFS